ncbi:Collagen alpha [Sesbania bispinosa]|nr:Collagen alpha [Sesbania bispinosa]
MKMAMEGAKMEGKGVASRHVMARQRGGDTAGRKVGCGTVAQPREMTTDKSQPDSYGWAVQAGTCDDDRATM